MSTSLATTDNNEQLQYTPENFAALLEFFLAMDKMRGGLRVVAHNNLRNEALAGVLCRTADQIERRMVQVKPVAPTRVRGVSYGYHPILADLALMF